MCRLESQLRPPLPPISKSSKRERAKENIDKEGDVMRQGIRSVTCRILLKIRLPSRFFAIEVSPSFALDERKLIGDYTDNISVFAVYFFNTMGKVTLSKTERIWYVCCRPGFRTWIDGKRM